MEKMKNKMMMMGLLSTGKKFMNEKLSMDMTSSFFVVSTKILSPGSNSEL